MTKIACIVGEDLVVIDARNASLLLKLGHVEHENAAGVVGCDIVIDIGADRVLNLNSRNIVFSAIVPDDNIARLSDINAGIRSPDRDIAFNQNVGRLHRIDAIRSVLLARTVRPFGPDTADRDILAFVDLERIALCIFDCEILDRKVACGNQQALCPGDLIGKTENGFVHPCPADRYAIHRQAQTAIEIVRPFRNFDDITWLGINQLRHQGLFGADFGFRRISLRRLSATCQYQN